MSETGKDSLLMNKIMAGILTAGLAYWGANRIAAIVVPDEAPKIAAITITGMVTAAAPAAGAVALPSLIPLLVSADVSKGAAFVQQQCSSCHTVSPGGAAGVGPNLYGVLGGPMFSGGGFSYSDAAKAKAKGNWDYDSMNAWLDDPQHYDPGTAMSYSGIKNTQTRADVVAYLRSLSASPIPLPTPAQIKAASAPAATPAATPAAAASAPAAPSFDTLFATADLTKGQALVQQECSTCHTMNAGAAAGVGPNLYGIVGAKMFAQIGFTYTDAVKAKAGGTWTADTLGDWLKDPQAFAAGTAMSFAGIHNDQSRADVIAWLNSNSAHPAKLPGTK